LSIYDNFDNFQSEKSENSSDEEEFVSEEESDDEEVRFIRPPVLRRQHAVNYNFFHPGCLDG
jgi:hypothetical protein